MSPQVFTKSNEIASDLRANNKILLDFAPPEAPLFGSTFSANQLIG